MTKTYCDKCERKIDFPKAEFTLLTERGADQRFSFVLGNFRLLTGYAGYETDLCEGCLWPLVLEAIEIERKRGK